MKKLYLLFVFAFLLCRPGFAQFSGAYAPSHWTTTKSSEPGVVNTGSVHTSGAPSSIALTGSNDPADPLVTSPVSIDYTITAATSGVFSFHWAYSTNNHDKNPEHDIAGVLIGGVFTQLSANTVDATVQSGNFSHYVTAGTVIGFRVSALDNSHGHATLTISSFTPPSGVLPVLLTAFTALAQEDKVLLQWLAVTEINILHYEVEHSGGSDFRKVGHVPAGQAGGSYDFTHTAQAGTQYYRLRMVDRDGSFSYSATRAVKAAAGAMLQLYPNPATDRVQVTIQAAGAGSETLELYSAAGVLLQQKTIVLAQGTNSTSMDVSLLPPGLYHVRTRKTCQVQMFLKR